MTERQVNMNYLKGKYISPTWVNMLEECQEWYKEGLKQGKFDEEMGKQQLISFLEDKINMCDGVIDTTKSDLRKTQFTFNCKKALEDTLEKNELAKNIFQEVLDFVNKGGKE